jgi:serine/threonine-protein kinase
VGQVEARLDHDAKTANYQGVARCISSGLRQGELDAARRRFLAVHRSAETKGMVHALTARSYEAQGQLERAQEQYQKALGEDPLNLELHRGYWALKRKLEERRHGFANRRPPPTR